MRIGIGHDTHRLGPGGPLKIGGVTLEYDRHLIGHSDADVLLHAVTDALLGALAAGDIGDLFPDTDPRHQGQDSAEFLLEAKRRVQAAGYEVVNLDCIVFAQRPKLVPYKLLIRQRLAELLGISLDCVSVKAKTGEQVGPVGREEAIMAECIVLLAKG
ncbi:MAG: 2-C-methyl-D-erythritol 2,4-cyclodiphosphate synthase [Planctomycetales bacterium]|nr:2-C-methyl-D-erythritol 2,4-cyclodiphosphate synthase [Planctomycetales bacterium]